MPDRTDHIKLTYTLTFEAGFHCGSGLSRLLVDRAVRRDAKGYLIVPGSTVKGTLRDQCEQLARLFGLVARSPHDEVEALREYRAPDLLARLFGSRLRGGGLCFDDLTMAPEDREFFDATLSLQTSERTQVSISRRTGAARPEALFSSEFGFTGLRFNGEIAGHISDLPLEGDADSPTYGLLLLLAGLISLDRVGGNKSTGLGRCRTEIMSLTINNDLREFSQLLTRLSDLEYADFARETNG
ncbi:MAG TPA: RAMP superfamily CRISPR-associated protein [Blastocatellia bacterium]|nr:RAMP superfamily CRISPR-associated protein [Blastocatellia bacterium]